MALHSVVKTFQPGHLGEQKHEMLSLNQRLENYLNRVRLLEEENALLAKKIQAGIHNSRGAMTRRKGLEEELRQTRLEVDAAWRESVHTELEIGKLAKEFQTLDLQLQEEAQAHAKARAMLEHSRKELEEEQRAQIWLREKVSQLENEMKHLIQSHQEEVARLEATATHSRAPAPPALAHRANHIPNVLQLEQEYAQMASRAWQEASDAYEGQLARLEESLEQTTSCLAKVKQEKGEILLRIQALQKEMTSAQDERLHLEKTAVQQRDRHGQELQQLEEHMDGLEVEKAELGQQIDDLLLENRHLVQLKVSLGLEVASYRALLDSESLRGDKPVMHQPRNISYKDAVYATPQGFKKAYQTHLSASRKITSYVPVCGVTGTRPAVTTAKPDSTSKPVNSNETADVIIKCEASYPKILQDGAVENFRPQEVHEKVTQAEPLSPPTGDEVLVLTTSEDKECEENGNSIDAEAEEIPDVESAVSSQFEPGVSSEPPLSEEHHNLLTTCLVRMTETSCGLLDEPDIDVEVPVEKEDEQQPQATDEASSMKDCTGKEEVQEDTLDSETEAVIESRTSSPTSECEPEESAFKQFTDFSQGESIQHEINSSAVETNKTNVEDKLYPDGEEMDTWDSVIEKKADLKTDDEKTKEEAKGQHAEPEEDISTREPGHIKKDIRQEFATEVQSSIVSSVMDTQDFDEPLQAMLDQEQVLISDRQDDEEDSQNVSVSWRTEVEGDSYAHDNTLADTRPLIRYKSDETDANTHASHMDESESTEGEKIGEMGNWTKAKSNKFGTMEDLCEEVEGEALDEEYDMGYGQPENRNVDHMTTGDYATLMKDTEIEGEEIQNVTEGRLGAEAGKLSEPMVKTSINYDEELETDRHVEQELENLCTESYSFHFAQQHDCESQETLNLQDNCVEKMIVQDEATLSCTNPGESVTYELQSSATTVDEPNENLHLSEWSVVKHQADALSDDEAQHEDQKVIDAPRDECSVSMATHAAEREDGVNDFTRRSDVEEISYPEHPHSALQGNWQDVAAPLEMKVALVDVTKEFEESLEFPDVTEPAVLENPTGDCESRDESEDGEKCDYVPEPAESHHHDDKGSDEAPPAHEEELLEIFPDSVPAKNDIFVVKDSTELMSQSGTDNQLHDVFSSGMKKDFWASSVETSTAHQQGDACCETDEHTNQSLGFGDNLVWGDLENENAVNGNSRVESTKALAAEEEQGQMQPEVKKVLKSNGEGEMVHSEESEIEGESWSSGEEQL